MILDIIKYTLVYFGQRYMSTDKLWPDKAITVKTREKRQDRITDKRLWTKEAFVSEEGNIQGFVSEKENIQG